LRSAKNVSGGDGSERIFVQIPAYRDTELAATLHDMYEKARAPDRLRVVVFWQRAAHDVLPARVRRLPNLELIEIPYAESRGCNWARNLLQDRWRGEPYTVLLDSHHRFADGWDSKARSMYSTLIASGVRRPLLTGYLPPYHPDREPKGRKRKPYKIYPLERQHGMLLRLTSYPIPFWRRLKTPIPADFVSLHFVFTDGGFNRDVRFDPHTYFVGDEVATSVRAYTSGFDLYHPHLVLGWHCYDRSSRVPHWNDHAEWREQNAQSLARLRRLFLGRLRGPYGTGRHRSVKMYEERLQLSLVESRGP
jgi:hypothetical protein